MIVMEDKRRFDVYKPSVHGRKWIGASNKLNRAMAIGERLGCRERGCPCGKYEIHDNKLKTDDVFIMIKSIMYIKK